MSTLWRAAEWALPEVPHVPPGDLERVLAAGRELAPVARGLAEEPWRYLATLATLGADDLTSARALEPHLDAVAILAQAGDPDLGDVGVDDHSTFGVYAARAPGAVLRAAPGRDGGLLLSGRKAWCSLATTVTHALVTVEDGERPGLYALPLRHRGVRHESGTWVSRGLAGITTGTLELDEVPAVPVGGPRWYLERPGFAWGGIGVAAVWFGGAAALAGRLVDAAALREPDQVALMHLGRADRALHGALLALRDAALVVAAGDGTGPSGALLAARVRATVAAAAEDVLATVGHALGPAPLTHDEEHARRVADLTVYLRQHHAERDLAALGRLVLGALDGS
ncbi:acyl-CoA dehydrogenase [Phycicoccus endophyticus]|uniref:Acyl-CoA dehydrogenase n=1 Tax=Phycicoccus endophyticus TaxID=1690220 RepID=A0A7G9QZZ0_9MICO|nr:acyl-CoA dehydrogenase [Phycicoccus endophyticus]NHI20774.1 acyl-CoA dehydrogenase [Phycicoccus endophyticus]QNN48915.1 acyl-CoA dehydrogenase [Phycicoccus endophyticus]GGL43835.1 acyl-CoA dehydrogenase [Phycicoccus endophyticus]